MTYLGFGVREWFRSAPLRREWKARVVTFRTELDWVRYRPDGEMKRMARCGTPRGRTGQLDGTGC
jgi:hypothetical protein